MFFVFKYVLFDRLVCVFIGGMFCSIGELVFDFSGMVMINMVFFGRD